MSIATLDDAVKLYKKRIQMSARPGNIPQQQHQKQLTINDTISKCLVVFYLRRVNKDEVATNEYMDRLLGVSTESIRQVKPYPTKDPNILAIFVEMVDTRLATFVYKQWKNTEPDVFLFTAGDYLCKVAAKKFQKPSFDNPTRAFHALYKPNTLAALFYQTPRTVPVHVGQPNTAPIQPFNNQFRFPSVSQPQQPIQQLQRQPPPSLHDVINID
jgi:hypothetical protein